MSVKKLVFKAKLTNDFAYILEKNEFDIFIEKFHKELEKTNEQLKTKITDIDDEFGKIKSKIKKRIYEKRKNKFSNSHIKNSYLKRVLLVDYIL